MISITQYINENYSVKTVNSGIGSLIGSPVGSLIGAPLGYMVGGPIGGLVGGSAGALIGGYTGGKIGGKFGSSETPADFNNPVHRIGVLSKYKNEYPQYMYRAIKNADNPDELKNNILNIPNPAKDMGYGKKRQFISKAPPISVLSYTPILVGATPPKIQGGFVDDNNS